MSDQPVNSQITDAVTQANVKVVGEAATTLGLTQLYSLETTAVAGAPAKVAQTGVADNLTSLLTVLNAFKGGNGQS
ncbi:hypothetical protein GE253_01745 [Niveispirillum sp. SYP-B3756]|uniref:RebB family R body protein n=1 Tax=Niveispirillum sp. SYP-B3756 TaxID=2662178 RepID=UPI00129137DB|nr:RebB family R body protein [Niveispirillum sp. SYP-B3756]MQP64058.1 hypothetical protein [Niveispirillum sp. SYP-B3756]